ncbi:unannotated protein [freshwater metagenome]|uniref:Unannotated protein n=1 Tax=freshwater metagenome TaxID=449393 RepID=A0A6J7HHX4_9ZZZZ|nr:hypothetical protein [Actinomycetota bacterium]
MSVAGPILVVALFGLVAWFVSAPLRRGAVERAVEAIDGQRADLEAARDAKYREIRDLEMDHRTGKLSDEDWRQLDRGLRAEAVDLLHRLDELNAADGDGPGLASAPERVERATIAQR